MGGSDEGRNKFVADRHRHDTVRLQSCLSKLGKIVPVDASTGMRKKGRWEN